MEKAEKIYDEVIAAHPKHLAAHLLLVQNIENTDLKVQFPFSFAKSLSPSENSDESKLKEDNQKIRKSLERIVQLCDQVIKDTDKDALLAYYGLKNDTRPDASKIKS